MLNERIDIDDIFFETHLMRKGSKSDYFYLRIWSTAFLLTLEIISRLWIFVFEAVYWLGFTSETGPKFRRHRTQQGTHDVGELGEFERRIGSIVATKATRSLQQRDDLRLDQRKYYIAILFCCWNEANAFYYAGERCWRAPHHASVCPRAHDSCCK